jgi:hypothetical protein
MATTEARQLLVITQRADGTGKVSGSGQMLIRFSPAGDEVPRG